MGASRAENIYKLQETPKELSSCAGPGSPEKSQDEYRQLALQRALTAFYRPTWSPRTLH